MATVEIKFVSANEFDTFLKFLVAKIEYEYKLFDYDFFIEADSMRKIVVISYTANDVSHFFEYKFEYFDDFVCTRNIIHCADKLYDKLSEIDNELLIKRPAIEYKGKI